MRAILLSLMLVACGETTASKTPEKSHTEAAPPPKAAAVTPAEHGAHDGAPSAEFVQIGGPGKRVFFVDLATGAKVKSPLHVKFGSEGLEIKPAGDGTPNSGHNHVLIDGKPIPAGDVVPKDDKNIHYGKGETETDLTLTPGEHTLTLQLADHAHRSYGPPLSETITVTVE